MARSDHTLALRRVANSIGDADLLTPLSYIDRVSRPRDAVDFLPMLLNSVALFHTAARQFGVAEKQVCKVMKLHALFDQGLWRELVDTSALEARQLRTLRDLHGRVYFLANYVHDLVALTNSQHIAPELAPAGKSVLALAIKPFGGSADIETTQLIRALHGLELIHCACCKIIPTEPTPILLRDWRARPTPVVSVLLDAPSRSAIDQVNRGLSAVIAECAEPELAHSLAGCILASGLFAGVGTAGETGAIDAGAYDGIARMLLDGCLEMLSAGVIPPEMPIDAQARLEGIAAIAARELREQRVARECFDREDTLRDDSDQGVENHATRHDAVDNSDLGESGDVRVLRSGHGTKIRKASACGSVLSHGRAR